MAVFFASCKSDSRGARSTFTLLDAGRTGITFSNSVVNTEDFNILEYLYFYDGGGVAVGDVNKDGLQDVFFTGNQSPNKLYLNKGGFRFEDVTAKAGVGGSGAQWSTGVTMADVNGDGWVDIYVCQVNYKSMEGHNLLYINNGDTTFTEQSAAYGLDFEGLSTQSAFFDYDRDGDLDVYLLNHSVHTSDTYTRAWRRSVDVPHGDKLYRNDGGTFTDVTAAANVYSSALGYGLGLAISDINLDGWPDIYVGNDFHENDYLYLNNGDGAFEEVLQRVIGHTSTSSMGNDVADFNNDGRPDIVSLDMLPEDVATYRTTGSADSESTAQIKREFGYAPQYTRNTLQLHRGFDGNRVPLFSEIGLYAGVHATDWSWASLFADLNNDGWKDLYVTNGIPGRPNDLDYIREISRPDVQRLLSVGRSEASLDAIEKMPAARTSNYAFRNNGDLTFTDRSAVWGLDAPGYSNGAAYADLDNDGDLDLIVNNINEPAFVYRNNTETPDGGHYLNIELAGAGKNTSGIGSKVLIRAGDEQFYQEHMPTRGFQSSISHVLHFGLGERRQIDTLLVIWPDGRFQRVENVETDQRLVLRQEDAGGSYPYRDKQAPKPALRDVTSAWEVDFVHREDESEDLERHPLLPHKLSTQGPALAVGDVNQDGLDDFFVGGAHQQPGRLFAQNEPSRFEAISQRTFDLDRGGEDVDAAFLDVDEDGDLDLYVVRGGEAFPAEDSTFQDRLYLNDGAGHFSRVRGRLPEMYSNGACVAPTDYDGDGDIDLFVGSRSVPGRYGRAPRSYLLENDGTGHFADVTTQQAPELERIGMVTDAVWTHIDGNGQLDLVVTGEWMPITIFQQSEGQLNNVTESLGLGASNGWWNSLMADDFDGDGDVDLVAGNLGANSVLQASEEAPLVLFVADFDGNTTPDPILAEYRDERLLTWARREELLQQLPHLHEKMPSYASYATMTVQDLFEEEQLEHAERKRVYTFESSYFENQRDGFVRRKLPSQVQFAPVQAMVSGDFDGDRQKDILTAGNSFGADTKQGRYDASYGTLLIGDGKGKFEALSIKDSGFVIKGEARAVERIGTRGANSLMLIARNDDTLQIYRRNIR